jgi:hypothetical protein
MGTHQSRRPGRLATGLGVFSLGLGAVQLVAPGRLNRAIGLRDDDVSRFWQRVVGAQELSAAAGILGPPPTRPFLWERTAGDVRTVTGDDPLQVARDALRRFKQLVETGEIVRSEGAPGGHSARDQPKQRPARPVEA